jgi:hypothetical protein
LPARCGMPAPSRGIIRIVLGNRGPRPTARVGGGGGGRLRCGRAERSDLAVAGSVPSSVPCRRCSASMSDIAAWRDACDRPAAARIGARFDTGQITSTPTTTSTSRSFGIFFPGWRTLLTRARHREQRLPADCYRPRPARGVRPGRGAQRALLGAGGLDAVPLPAWRHPDVGAGATGRPVGLLGGWAVHDRGGHAAGAARARDRRRPRRRSAQPDERHLALSRVGPLHRPDLSPQGWRVRQGRGGPVPDVLRHGHGYPS